MTTTESYEAMSNEVDDILLLPPLVTVAQVLHASYDNTLEINVKRTQSTGIKNDALAPR